MVTFPRSPFRTLVIGASLFALGSVATMTRAAETPAQPAATPPTVRLWEGDAPGATGQKPQDIPTLTAYMPEPSKRNGASVLVLPGGGYGALADHEGRGYAEWFAANGVTAYVLKYRLGSAGYRHPVMLQDAARALRMVRSFAKRDGLDPARVAVIGSSAGGHLAATLATQFASPEAKPSTTDTLDAESARPDVAILCYPVITMGQFTHNGSKQNLLGKEPSPDLVNRLSAEQQVTEDTPPCFVWSTYEDRTVPIENSLLFVQALRKANIPLAFHVYEKGPHGLGLGRPNRPAPPWADQLVYWLKERKFLP